MPSRRPASGTDGTDACVTTATSGSAMIAPDRKRDRHARPSAPTAPATSPAASSAVLPGPFAANLKADAQQLRVAARHPPPARRAEGSPPLSAPSDPKATVGCHAAAQPPRTDPQSHPDPPPCQPPNTLGDCLAAQSKFRNTPIQWDKDGAYPVADHERNDQPAGPPTLA